MDVFDYGWPVVGLALIGGAVALKRVLRRDRQRENEVMQRPLARPPGSRKREAPRSATPDANAKADAAALAALILKFPPPAAHLPGRTIETGKVASEGQISSILSSSGPEADRYLQLVEKHLIVADQMIEQLAANAAVLQTAADARPDDTAAQAAAAAAHTRLQDARARRGELDVAIQRARDYLPLARSRTWQVAEEASRCVEAFSGLAFVRRTQIAALMNQAGIPLLHTTTWTP